MLCPLLLRIASIDMSPRQVRAKMSEMKEKKKRFKKEAKNQLIGQMRQEKKV